MNEDAEAGPSSSDATIVDAGALDGGGDEGSAGDAEAGPNPSDATIADGGALDAGALDGGGGDGGVGDAEAGPSPSDATVVDAGSLDAADASSDAFLPSTFGASCGGTHTILNGTAFAPNGLDPIPRVRVYAASEIRPYPTSYCDLCSAPIDLASASTQSDADGSFTLNLDAVPSGAAITFAIQIGRFRKYTTLPVTPCTTASVPVISESLPGNSASGNIPKIAVSSGNVDHLDAVLRNAGITEYDCYQGTTSSNGSTSTCTLAAGTTIADVLAASTTLDQYDVLLLSSGPGAYASFVESNGSQTVMTANLSAWVGAGGRVFADGASYDYIAQPFPADITLAGPTGSPQPVDGDQIGCAPAGSGGTSAHAVLYTSTIDDPVLAQWLQAVGIIPTPPPSPPTAGIQGFYQPWSVMFSLPATTQLMVDGTLPIDPTYPTTACGSPTLKDVPLAARFDVNACGRVDYTSIQMYTGTGSTSLAANARLLEYSIFDIASCQP